MNRTEIFNKLKEIIKATIGESPKINNCTESDSLTDDLGLNSIGILYVVIAIEDAFNISFEDVGFNDFKTVGSVVDFIIENLD